MSELRRIAFESVAMTAAAYELALELDELDDEDGTIVREQLDAAGCHLADLVWHLHPDWYGLSDREAHGEALRAFREHRPEMTEPRDRVGLVRTIQRCGETIDRQVALEGEPARTMLNQASDHLALAVLVLIPDQVRSAAPSDVRGSLRRFERIVEDARRRLRSARN